VQLLNTRFHLCIWKPSINSIATLKAYAVLELGSAATRGSHYSVLQDGFNTMALPYGTYHGVVDGGSRGRGWVAAEQVPSEASGQTWRRRLGGGGIEHLLDAHGGHATGAAVVVDHDVVLGDGGALVAAGPDGQYTKRAVPFVEKFAGEMKALALGGE
jgi:hypothetical protein